MRSTLVYVFNLFLPTSLPLWHVSVCPCPFSIVAVFEADLHICDDALQRSPLFKHWKPDTLLCSGTWLKIRWAYLLELWNNGWDSVWRMGFTSVWKSRFHLGKAELFFSLPAGSSFYNLTGMSVLPSAYMCVSYCFKLLKGYTVKWNAKYLKNNCFFCPLILLSFPPSRYPKAQRSTSSQETSPSSARSRRTTFPMAMSTSSTGPRRSTGPSPPSLSSGWLETSTSK